MVVEHIYRHRDHIVGLMTHGSGRPCSADRHVRPDAQGRAGDLAHVTDVNTSRAVSCVSTPTASHCWRSESGP